MSRQFYMHRVLLSLVLMAPPAVQAGEIRISVHIPWWWPLVLLDKREPPSVSRHHLQAPPPGAKDACTFVAGVRHCPRAEPE